MLPAFSIPDFPIRPEFPPKTKKAARFTWNLDLRRRWSGTFFEWATSSAAPAWVPSAAIRPFSWMSPTRFITAPRNLGRMGRPRDIEDFRLAIFDFRMANGDWQP